MQPVGQETLCADFRHMRQTGHLPHALLLHGESGCGKKHLAMWFAALVLCEHADTAPCGTCKSCRMLAEHSHPDLCIAEHSGKRGGFSIETVRNIRKEAVILPHHGQMRVFLFGDADDMSLQAQNALLKSVEEPPAHTCFVFTTETVGALLPTLLSRMTICPVYPVTTALCRQVLAEHDYSVEDCNRAIGCFGGNIGHCLAYLEDKSLQQTVDYAKQLTSALAEQNEYELLRLLSAAAKDKETLRAVLQQLLTQIRDAAALTREQMDDRIGCDADSAARLAAWITPTRTIQIYEAIQTALLDLDGNVGAMLTASALCSRWMQIGFGGYQH